MERLALDTTFLVDLQNEHRTRREPRGAIAFLQANASTEMLLPVVALGEYLEGFDDPTSSEALALVAPLRVLPVTADVASLYATNARSLRKHGRLIGSNDLWIACTARASDLPIVTRNVDEFRRVAGLHVVEYG